MHIFHICRHIYPFLDGCKKSWIAEIEDIVRKERIFFQNIPNSTKRWNFPSSALISSFFPYFRSVFNISFLHFSCDISFVLNIARHMFLPCFFSMRFKMLSKYFQSFFRQFHFLISRYCKNIPLAYVPSLLFSMLTGPISPLRCCLQRIFC